MKLLLLQLLMKRTDTKVTTGSQLPQAETAETVYNIFLTQGRIGVLMQELRCRCSSRRIKTSQDDSLKQLEPHRHFHHPSQSFFNLAALERCQRFPAADYLCCRREIDRLLVPAFGSGLVFRCHFDDTLKYSDMRTGKSISQLSAAPRSTANVLLKVTVRNVNERRQRCSAADDDDTGMFVYDLGLTKMSDTYSESIKLEPITLERIVMAARDSSAEQIHDEGDGTQRRACERVKKLGVVLREFFKTMHEVQGKTSKGLSSRHSQQEVYPPQDVLQLYVEVQERKMNMWSQQKSSGGEDNLDQAISNLAQKNSWCRKMDRKLKWI
ncbi:hypothetical protein D9C73_021524 [Collichthys lucidus]|uniref:Uncharacterized protein n=1 Tax=Collichthys lucidus TaxID=240159 RepID=A0A4U5VI19_COLLU|nr:hypothetical protein D9C73_021524 [Collichthys lucidus]